MNDPQLRDAVDQLTKARQTPTLTLGGITCLVPGPPLLTALYKARTANIGQGAGTTALHERNTLNIAASELYTSIQQQVRQWALNAQVPRHWSLSAGPVDWRDPAQLLRAWHTRTLADPHLDPRYYDDKLRRWINAINDLVINPPRRIPLNAPCPLCGQRWTLDSVGDQIDCLIVIERDNHDQTIATCRNCEAVWSTITGLRRLRIAIDDANRVAS